ncbi:hypothetical protein BDA96_04G368400 [Sorghum bicolor]|uniref:Uncharacterized protein n=1 Tax=Sorghum bicolor TaxID=4558 RepID=A0A921ULE7_SORBI|nr:hypothetical protein BDA96_04G368400 [Sorghum bicolor]
MVLHVTCHAPTSNYTLLTRPPRLAPPPSPPLPSVRPCAVYRVRAPLPIAPCLPSLPSLTSHRTLSQVAISLPSPYLTSPLTVAAIVALSPPPRSTTPQRHDLGLAGATLLGSAPYPRRLCP